jgi:hypothetical protein
MAKLSSHPVSSSDKGFDTHVKPVRRSIPGIPGWVKVLVILGLLLVLLFVILHLTGQGFGEHLHMSALEYGVLQLWL